VVWEATGLVHAKIASNFLPSRLLADPDSGGYPFAAMAPEHRLDNFKPDAAHYIKRNVSWWFLLCRGDL
jgi:hypothetical protein